MTDQFDRFADSASRTLDALGWDSNVDVYQPTETYTPGDGFDVSYPDTPTVTLDGALDVPSDAPGIDEGGTTETADLSVYVRADVSVEFNTAGETDEALTGIEIDGRKYVVDTVEEQFDGMIALSCDEVDGWR